MPRGIGRGRTIKEPPQVRRARPSAVQARKRVRPPTLPTERKPMAKGFIPPKLLPPQRREMKRETAITGPGGIAPWHKTGETFEEYRKRMVPPKPAGKGISPKMQWLLRMADRGYKQKDIDEMAPRKPWLRPISAPPTRPPGRREKKRETRLLGR